MFAVMAIAALVIDIGLVQLTGGSGEPQRPLALASRGVLRRRFSTSRTRDQAPEVISEEPTDVEPPNT
jgi:hypothetical protein